MEEPHVADDSIADVETANCETGENSSSQPSQPPSIPSASGLESNRPRTSKRISRSDEASLTHDVLLSVQNHFKRPAVLDDRFDIYAKTVAFKIRDLPNEQRLLAERIINDTLFVAEMGKLDIGLKLISEQVINRNVHTPTPSQIPHHYQQQTYTYNQTPHANIPNPSPSPMQQYYEPYPYHSLSPQPYIPENSERPFLINLNNNNNINDNNTPNNNCK